MGPLDLLTPEPAPLLGGPPARNAYVELHNLIAAAERPSEFGPADRDRIGRRWGVDLASSFPAERLALYQTLLDDALADGDLGGAERALLAHVADTLALSDAALRPAHERAFGRAVEAAVADDALTDDERGLLYTLQHTLGFDPDLADGAYDVFARRRLLTVVAHALADGEVSPAEAGEVDRACEALSVTVPGDLAGRLAEAEAQWRARRGALPEVHVSLPLRPGETPHFMSANAMWQGVDGVALWNALSDSGGLDRLRDEDVAALSVPKSAFSGDAERGHVVLTSERLLARPACGEPDDYPLEGVVRVLRFSNGVVVETRDGARTLFDFGADTGEATALLFRLLRPALEPPRPAPTGEVFFRASGVSWQAVDEEVAASSPRLRAALETGETSGLRLGGAALADVPTRGEAVVSDRALVLSGAGERAEYPLAEMRPPRRFLNGLLVRAGPRAVLVDAGGRTDALYTTLRRTLAGPDQGAAASGWWRKALAADVRAATQTGTTWAGWWLFRRPVPPRPEDVARALGGVGDSWGGRGTVRVTDTHLVFEGEDERWTSRRTVTGVVQSGRALWVRRRLAHDWAVRFETDADAARIARALGAGR